MNIEHIDTEKNAPSLVGNHGRAWELNLPAIREENRKTDTTVAGWIVFAPWAHLAWSYYGICVIHLRDVPGVEPAHVSLPNATHEILVMALDPSRVPDLKRPGSTGLRPLNFVGQWIETGATDEERDNAAAERLRLTVGEILAGQLSPDTDFTNQWVARFGDACLRS